MAIFPPVNYPICIVVCGQFPVWAEVSKGAGLNTSKIHRSMSLFMSHDSNKRQYTCQL